MRAGIATGAAITYFSNVLWPMYIAASIDGCTSCMFGLGQVCNHPFFSSWWVDLVFALPFVFLTLLPGIQAYISDLSSAKDLPENLGMFMGTSRRTHQIECFFFAVFLCTFFFTVCVRFSLPFCVCMVVCMCACKLLCAWVCAYVCMHASACIFVCTCICIRVYACMCVCMSCMYA